jgi:hypothetical protein
MFSECANPTRVRRLLFSFDVPVKKEKEFSRQNLFVNILSFANMKANLSVCQAKVPFLPRMLLGTMNIVFIFARKKQEHDTALTPLNQQVLDGKLITLANIKMLHLK